MPQNHDSSRKANRNLTDKSGHQASGPVASWLESCQTKVTTPEPTAATPKASLVPSFGCVIHDERIEVSFDHYLGCIPNPVSQRPLSLKTDTYATRALPKRTTTGFLAVASVSNGDQRICLKSRRYGNEKANKSCNSYCRGRDFARLVCISAIEPGRKTRSMKISIIYTRFGNASILVVQPLSEPGHYGAGFGI